MEDSVVSAERPALEALENAGIDYIRISHPQAVTMELCRGIGAEFGAAHCKNLFLTNKRGDDFRLLLMDPEKPFRTSEVSRALGVTRMSFASEESLGRVMGLVPGAVTVMGLVNASAKKAYEEGRLHIVIDEDLFKRERICVHPNHSGASLVLKTEDLPKLIRSLGYEAKVIRI
ncbi:MAG: prolyl-tRNA synthetase associated domain-containing protein [Clostridia bacterium]|nr:prolyl-tRNA synthetase associated domain-containing protein [Clostridia bacterium]